MNRSLLYIIGVAKGTIKQLIAFRSNQLCNRCNVTDMGRKDTRLIIVMNCGGSLNAKKGIQDFPIRTQG
jgi:hypothetical protein